MIDLEIGILEQQHQDYTSQVDKSQGVSEEMLGVAQRVFGAGYDPKLQKENAMEVVEFAVGEGGQDPASMMNVLVDLDRIASSRYPKLDFVSRVWTLMQEIKVDRATRALARGA